MHRVEFLFRLTSQQRYIHTILFSFSEYKYKLVTTAEIVRERNQSHPVSSQPDYRTYLIVSDALISRVKFLMGEEMFSEMETVLTRPCRLSLFPVDRIGVNGLTPRTGDKSVFPSLVDGLEEDEEFSSAEGSTGDGGSLLEDVSLDSVLDVAPGPVEKTGWGERRERGGRGERENWSYSSV